MFSKIVKQPFRSVGIRKAGFSSLKKTISDLFHPVAADNVQTKIANFDPLKQVTPLNNEIRENGDPRYQTTKLSNGVTILTESNLYPNVIDLGVLLDLGARDESHETSGSLLTLKNSYNDIISAINPSYNDIVQNMGGELDMEYDQESTYVKANCLAHHVDDIFSTMAESILKPITASAGDAAILKMRQEYQMMEEMGGVGEDLNDSIMRTAYGLKGLGMPLQGMKDNFMRLSTSTIQRFQAELINPNKIYVCAAGVDDHQEFVKLVESKLSFLPSSSFAGKTREPAEYRGGESRNENGGEEVTLALAFKSGSWKDSDVYAFQVLNTLMGSSASFSTGGPGKGMHSRATKHLLNRLSFVDSANSLCTCFSDSGLFGLILSGPSNSSVDLLRALTNELKLLSQPINPIELQRAKNITKSNILMALERQKDRLEESVKNIKTFGKLTFHEYCENIDKVTGEQINTAVARMLFTRPTFVAEGGGVNRLPNYDKIQNMLRL